MWKRKLKRFHAFSINHKNTTTRVFPRFLSKYYNIYFRYIPSVDLTCNHGNSVNTTCWPNVDLLLAHCFRRWPNINPTRGAARLSEVIIVTILTYTSSLTWINLTHYKNEMNRVFGLLCTHTLRPSTLPLGLGGSPQYWNITNDHGRNISFLWNVKVGVGFEPDFPSRQL